jgi:hypothetical protein
LFLDARYAQQASSRRGHDGGDDQSVEQPARRVQLIDDIPVIDAVVHAYDMSPGNYANDMAKPISELTYFTIEEYSLPGYRPTDRQLEGLTDAVGLKLYPNSGRHV